MPYELNILQAFILYSGHPKDGGGLAIGQVND